VIVWHFTKTCETRTGSSRRAFSKRKRKNLATDFRRKLAVEIAEHFSDAIIFIGHPASIGDKHYKGSGHRKNRKRINHWPFREFAVML
jgi:putative transposase